MIFFSYGGHGEERREEEEEVGGDVQFSVFELWDSRKTMPTEP